MLSLTERRRLDGSGPTRTEPHMPDRPPSAPSLETAATSPTSLAPELARWENEGGAPGADR